MNVVWHHAPCEQVVPFTVEMHNRTRNDGGYRRHLQDAVTVSGVKVGF